MLQYIQTQVGFDLLLVISKISSVSSVVFTNERTVMFVKASNSFCLSFFLLWIILVLYLNPTSLENKLPNICTCECEWVHVCSSGHVKVQRLAYSSMSWNMRHIWSGHLAKQTCASSLQILISFSSAFVCVFENI